MRQSNQIKINQDKKGNEKNDPSIEQLRNALANLFPSISTSSSTPRNSKNVSSDQQQQVKPSGIAKKKRGKQSDKIVPPAKKTKK